MTTIDMNICILSAVREPCGGGTSLVVVPVPDWARRVVKVLEDAGGSVAQMDGKMVDRPMADRARTILGNL